MSTATQQYNKPAPSKHLKVISMNRLIFTAMNEVLHSTYLNASQVKGFDSNLENKLRNMKAQLGRQLKDDFLFIEKQGGHPAMELFHNLTEVFEGFIEVANQGDYAYFERIILIMKAYREGTIEMQEGEG